VTTPSGLQIQDTVVGDGPAAEQGDIATVHYTGALDDGSEFDSSEGGTPFAFLLGATQVIAGWDEGVAGMKLGGERRLIVPPELGYGERGFSGVIPPNATLTFDIRLLAISAPPEDTPPEVSGEEIELESGLKAIDIVVGDGDVAVEGSTVAVHYTGWLEADGKQFDSSLLTRQGPQGQSAPPTVFSFTIGEQSVIRGWDAGVPGMKEGGKRRLLVPAALGYGTEGSPPDIPANANLIFDIELVEVVE
jgi:peptidylprolyl isomerase